MKAYDDAKASGDKNPAKAVAHLPGYYRCCMYKWKKQRKTQQWSLLCAVAPKLARKHHEMPDCLRTILKEAGKFGQRTPQGGDSEKETNILPPEFTQIVSDTVVLCRHSLFSREGGREGGRERERRERREKREVRREKREKRRERECVCVCVLVLCMHMSFES